MQNDPLNSDDPYGLNRRGRARYYNRNGLRNPYAELEYHSLRQQMRRVDPSFEVLRNTNRNITWREVNWLRDQLHNARTRAARRGCSNSSSRLNTRGLGNISSPVSMSESDALQNGINWLGPGYREVGPRGSGVFRSADNQRQFRITNSDITGSHGPLGPHAHFESLNIQGRVVENLHVPIAP